MSSSNKAEAIIAAADASADDTFDVNVFLYGRQSKVGFRVGDYKWLAFFKRVKVKVNGQNRIQFDLGDAKKQRSIWSGRHIKHKWESELTVTKERQGDNDDNKASNCCTTNREERETRRKKNDRWANGLVLKVLPRWL